MITIEKNCAGQCAKCESENIEYDTMVCMGDYVYYPYDCQHCGNKGKEHYTLVYEITETTIESYYCENCGEDGLDNPIDDGTGSIFCSNHCIEKSLEWRSEDIKKYITNN